MIEGRKDHRRALQARQRSMRAPLCGRGAPYGRAVGKSYSSRSIGQVEVYASDGSVTFEKFQSRLTHKFDA